MTITASPSETSALLDRLACPACRKALKGHGDGLICTQCASVFPIVKGVADLRPPDAHTKSEAADWSGHWADDKQETLAQRFFSVYRKAVFARTVAHFVHKHFPGQGTFAEAGCGTAETSMRIDKCGGGRRLVAVDLILPVLQRCHPIMDERVCGDIFRLPFADNSLDGIWNVGVMEHFTHPQINQIMREFHRVLRPGARVILLWPATFSIPQRMLRVVEFFVNRAGEPKADAEKFRFHPPEISQIRSIEEGRQVLNRNGFDAVEIDPGLWSLMAFETLVGAKKDRTRQ